MQRLDASSEGAEIRRRHATYFLAVAEQVENHWDTPDQARWVRRLDREHDNLRAALEWAFQNELIEIALRLAASMGEFWELRKYLIEGMTWLDKAVGLSAAAPPALQAKILLAAGRMASGRLEYERAARLYVQSLELARALGDQTHELRSLRALGINA
jgi:hypothetical protein